MESRRRFALVAVAALTLAPLAAAHAGDKENKKRSGGLTYMPLQTLLGATIRPNGSRGVLSVECGLDVPDAALRERAEQSIPLLRSAFVETVQAYAHGLPTGAPPNADFLARTLQRQTDQVLGRPGAKLLIGAILVN